MIIIGTFGDIFRTERQNQGIDLETVADQTKIRKHYLNALEQEDFGILPPRVYAIGFVATYARFLKLDADVMVSQFKNLAYHDQAPPPLVVTKKQPVREFKLPVKNIIAAALFLVIVFWTGNWITGYIAERGVTQPPAVQEPADVNPPEPNVPPENSPAVQPPVSDKLVLAISARQNCWLLITVDGSVQFTGIIPSGESKTFEAVSAIDIKAGNAGGIDLNLNDQPLAPLGNVGQVVEKHFDKNTIAKE
ncbi:MAG: DUF4115 domain-containing protein [Syntrophomonadaceae bacterium]|nr:DUF4115 domain-containing protein [Syntrophomonadaceae bacterium]